MDNNNNNNTIKPDLKTSITLFVKSQLEYLEKEHQAEEEETINKISTYSAKQLENLGFCIRKLEIVEKIYSAYGKYQIEFKKKTKEDISLIINKYKFDNGDSVGLFKYGDKIDKEYLYSGIVSQFNAKKIVVIFDEDIDEEKLPSNICLVKLANQVTYERIKNNLNKLKEQNFNQSLYPLINVLFDIYKPTLNDSVDNLNYIKDKVIFFNDNLNESQKDAVRFSLKINEIGLIHGPPGTGKTTTIVEVILQLLKLGNKILVCAPSNIAVDNIAEKLIKYKNLINFNNNKKNSNDIYNNNIELCRIGHPARLLQSVINECLDMKIENSELTKLVKKDKKEIETHIRSLKKLNNNEKEKRVELKNLIKSLRNEIKGTYQKTVSNIYQSMNVILSTCAGAGDNYLSKFKSDEHPFDYVVIDECAQGTESLCWIPILMGKKIILAGDHLQLPPTIKNKSIEKKLSFTLFDRLMKLYENDFSVMLNTQYRMNEKIMRYSSDELYNGKLIADESVKNHTIKDLIMNENKELSDNIIKADNFNIIDKSLILIDTSNYNFHETLDPETLSRCNFGEVEVCKIMTNYLISKLKLTPNDIGIITPYSAQVLTLSNSLNSENYPGLEISTVDGFQGREKEIIILSLVRSNEKNEIGFLCDKRRLNVGITRAKRMMIFIANIVTVGNGKNDDGFLKNLCIYLDKNAEKIDLFEVFGEICEDGDYNPQDKIQKIVEKCVPEMEEEKMISEIKNNNSNKVDEDNNKEDNNNIIINEEKNTKHKKFRKKKKNK